MASKYKRHSRGGRFKNQGEGLRTSIDRIRQQRQTEIDAMKLQAGQADAISKLQISGLKNVSKVESENAGKLKNLENEIYTKKRNAITVRSDREYESIMGEAKELGKSAAWWEKFATKHSKELGDAAKGLTIYAQYRQAVNNEETKDPTTAKNYEDIIRDSHLTNYGNASDDARQNLKNEPMIASDMLKKSQGNFFNHSWTGKELTSDVPAILAALERSNSGEINHQNYEELAIRAGYAIANDKGLPFGSKPFRDFIKTIKRAASSKASSMANYKRFNDDKDDMILQSKAYSSLMKDLITEQSTLDPNSMGYKKLQDKIQVIHKGYHQIANGSFQNLGNGNYGVVTRNPKQLNMEMITNTLPHLDFATHDDAAEFYDSILLFDPKDGKTVIEKGKPLGLLSKNKDVEDHLIEKFGEFDKKRGAAREIREKSKRLKTLLPFQEVFDEAARTGDFSKITAEFKLAAVKAGDTIDMKGTDEGKQLFVIGGFDKDKHGSAMKYAQYVSAVYSGDIVEANTIMVQQGGNNDGYAEFNQTSKDILTLPDQGKTITDMSKTILANYHKEELVPGLKATANPAQYEIIENLITKRIIQRMMSDETPNKSGQAKFNDAASEVAKEVKQGVVDGTGLFAAKKASDWVPAEYKDGEVVKAAYINKPDANASGFYFLAADSYVDPGEAVSQQAIQDKFFNPKIASFKESGNAYTNKFLQQRLSVNLNHESSIISDDEKRNIIFDSQSGFYDANSIPDNLKLIVATAKRNDSNITTKEVMDMVVNAITEGDEYKLYSGLKWSPNHEDLTKSLTGRCTGNAKNNFGICIEALANEKGYDINQQLLKVLYNR